VGGRLGGVRPQYGGPRLIRLGEERGGAGCAGLRSLACVASLAAASVLLANCSGSSSFGSLDPRYGVSSSARVVAPGEPVPKGGGYNRIGSPYTIGGRIYTPEENPNYRAEGVASWYGEDFHGRITANGEVFDMHSVSAAHPTMPLPSYARVTNLSNHKSVIVRVNDRGPYNGDRLIDVSMRAANLLGFYGSGLAPVRVEYVGRAPLEGSDDNVLMATLRQGEPAPTPSLVRVASAKPFVPAAVSRVALRDVPTPPDRPYGLGDGQVVSNYRPGGSQQTSAVARAREAEPPMRSPPALSAYAPTRPDFQSGGGVPYASAMRGLY
jgi:rare lipoprotein A